MPITGAENPLSNITVTAQRFSGPAIGGLSSVGFASGFSGNPLIFSANLGKPKVNLAFLAPAIPQVLEEIIATAPRAAASTTGAGAGAGLFWLAGALGVGYFLDRIVQTGLNEHFDSLYREWDAKTTISEAARLRKQKDATLFVNRPLGLPPETMPEAEPFVPVRPEVLPMPILPDPDIDPFRMPEVQPRVLPTQPRPVVVPLPISVPMPLRPTIPQTRPITVPAPLPLPIAVPLPFALPGILPQPFATPLGDPFSQPFAQPLADPKTAPFAVPFPSPKALPFSDPLTLVQPRGVDSPLSDPFAQPFAMPEPDLSASQCPPCKKDKEREEQRNQCYKKLVKEGRFSDLDTSYNWVQIDCDTGREL